MLHRCYRFRVLSNRTLQLSKYPALNNLEKQTSVPKVYAFLGLIGFYFFLIFFNVCIKLFKQEKILNSTSAEARS
jgi:hypothetical protein